MYQPGINIEIHRIPSAGVAASRRDPALETCIREKQTRRARPPRGTDLRSRR